MGVTRRAATRGARVAGVARVASPDAPCRTGANLAPIALGPSFSSSFYFPQLFPQHLDSARAVKHRDTEFGD